MPTSVGGLFAELLEERVAQLRAHTAQAEARDAELADFLQGTAAALRRDASTLLCSYLETCSDFVSLSGSSRGRRFRQD